MRKLFTRIANRVLYGVPLSMNPDASQRVDLGEDATWPPPDPQFQRNVLPPIEEDDQTDAGPVNTETPHPS